MMKWLDDIRLYIGRNLFNRELKFLERNRKVTGFAEARKIGILYDASEKENYELVKTYVRKLRSQQKDVSSLGFIKSKKFPGDKFIKLGMDFFTLSNLNWFFIPDSPVTDNFINEEFDIIINLDIYQSFPLQFISALSRASYRVGRYAEGNSTYFDFMIHLKNEDGLQEFISATDHYLHLIKN